MTKHSDYKYLEATATELNIPVSKVYEVVRAHYEFAAEAMESELNVRVIGLGVFKIKPRRRQAIEERRNKKKDVSSNIHTTSTPTNTNTSTT